MTVVVGWTDGKQAHIGADRMASNGQDPPFNVDKVKQREGWLYAASGVTWLGSIAQTMDAEQWKGDDVVALAKAIREALVADGWEKYENKGEPRSFNSTMLLARGGRLWALHGDFFPYAVEPARLVSFGSGADYAMGAAYGRRGGGKRLLVHCLEAAIALSPSCGLGYDIMKAP